MVLLIQTDALYSSELFSFNNLNLKIYQNKKA